MTTEEMARLTYSLARPSWREWGPAEPNTTAEYFSSGKSYSDHYIQCMEKIVASDYDCATYFFCPAVAKIAKMVVSLYREVDADQNPWTAP